MNQMSNAIPINTSPGAYQVAVIQMRKREPHIATTKSWKYLNETAAIGRGIFYYLDRFDPNNPNHGWIVNLLGQIQIRFTEISRQKFLDGPKRAANKKAREEKQKESKRQKHNARARAYRKKHPEKCRAAARAWHKRNPEKARSSDQNWSKKHLDKKRISNVSSYRKWRDKRLSKRRAKHRGPVIDATRISLLTVLTNRISQETILAIGTPANQSGDSGHLRPEVSAKK
jgi:hypothetical protein